SDLGAPPVRQPDPSPFERPGGPTRVNRGIRVVNDSPRHVEDDRRMAFVAVPPELDRGPGRDPRSVELRPEAHMYAARLRPAEDGFDLRLPVRTREYSQNAAAGPSGMANTSPPASARIATKISTAFRLRLRTATPPGPRARPPP